MEAAEAHMKATVAANQSELAAVKVIDTVAADSWESLLPNDQPCGPFE